MAFADHSVWVIQTFGGWRSEALLLYVREAILGVHGGTLAEQTELGGRTNIAKLRALVKDEVDRSRGTSLSPAMERAIAKPIGRSASLQTKLTDVRMHLQALAQGMEEVRVMTATVMNEMDEPALKALYRREFPPASAVHRMRTRAHAWCGWKVPVSYKIIDYKDLKEASVCTACRQATTL
jgi:hypothetical protein